jgi:hypothetical protein
MSHNAGLGGLLNRFRTGKGVLAINRSTADPAQTLALDWLLTG